MELGSWGAGELEKERSPQGKQGKAEPMVKKNRGNLCDLSVSAVHMNGVLR
jgi:hypothetical protein